MYIRRLTCGFSRSFARAKGREFISTARGDFSTRVQKPQSRSPLLRHNRSVKLRACLYRNSNPPTGGTAHLPSQTLQASDDVKFQVSYEPIKDDVAGDIERPIIGASFLSRPLWKLGADVLEPGPLEGGLPISGGCRRRRSRCSSSSCSGHPNRQQPRACRDCPLQCYLGVLLGFFRGPGAAAAGE